MNSCKIYSRCKNDGSIESGICKALSGLIPTADRRGANSIAEERPLWENSEENEIKEKCSEMINRIIHHRKPFVTTSACNPRYVPSCTISCHHRIILSNIIMLPINSNSWLHWWYHLIPVIVTKVQIAPVNSQHLWLNKWMVTCMTCP